GLEPGAGVCRQRAVPSRSRVGAAGGRRDFLGSDRTYRHRARAAMGERQPRGPHHEPLAREWWDVQRAEAGGSAEPGADGLPVSTLPVLGDGFGRPRLSSPAGLQVSIPRNDLLREVRVAAGVPVGAAVQPLTPPMVRPELMRWRNA